VITAVALLLVGFLLFSPARTNTITFAPATKDGRAKMWPVLFPIAMMTMIMMAAIMMMVRSKYLRSSLLR
jgi:threonine/homoserine/homoserine lactone efflux protein